MSFIGNFLLAFFDFEYYYYPLFALGLPNVFAILAAASHGHYGVRRAQAIGAFSGVLAATRILGPYKRYAEMTLWPRGTRLESPARQR